MTSLTPQGQNESLSSLVRRLVQEHRDFSGKEKKLRQTMNDDSELSTLRQTFYPLRESLIEHMLVEETDIFPEVSNRGLFDERISEIMQQHLEITAALDEMRFSLSRKDFQKLMSAFDDLVRVMHTHFPAEEKEVFPLVL